MTEKRAKIISIGFMCVSVFLGLHYTFVKQDIVLALVCISGYFTFQFGLENPKLLMSKSWKEFGEQADVATGKEKLAGTPLYFAAVFFSVLYIILV
jgi:hypothetical protein